MNGLPRDVKKWFFSSLPSPSGCEANPPASGERPAKLLYKASLWDGVKEDGVWGAPRDPGGVLG